MKQDELIAKTIFPVTPKHQYISVRSFTTGQERDLAQQKNARQWPNIRPNSTLICAMGNHWAPGSWNRVVDMWQYSTSQGIYVAIQEVQDRCFNPYDALGTMRNEAILTADGEGFEYLMYIDNDVLPPPDTLKRLLAWDMPIVVPLVLEPGTRKQLSGPQVQPNTGLHLGKWAVLSMMLFKTSVFRPYLGHFWSDAIGADEGFHFQRLWAETGHRVYIDSNTQVEVQGEPLYPLAMNRFSFEERTNIQKRTIERLNRPADRRAINPLGPNVIDGDYMPFVLPPEAKSAGMLTVAVPPPSTFFGWNAGGTLATNGSKPKEEVRTYGWSS